MLAKKFRLKEKEVKRVLHKGKPFFSYSIVFNTFPNRLGYSRFAVVIGGKSVPNNVIRNAYRRLYYDTCFQYTGKKYGDVVCVVKSKTKLLDTQEGRKKIQGEMLYLFDKKLGKNI